MPSNKFKKYDNEIRIINVDALTYAGNLENLADLELHAHRQLLSTEKDGGR